MQKISIIIPMYNAEKYIFQCIDSCVKQTMKEIQIIIVNDESTDNSLNIAQKFAKNDDRITILNQKNGGVSLARNNGIKESTSDWILFLDADDWLEYDAIEKLYNIVKKNDCDILIASYFSEYQNKSVPEKFLNISNYTFFEKEKERLILVENCIHKSKDNRVKSSTNLGVPWGKLYKKKFLEKNNCNFKIGLKRMQDMIFNLDAFYLSNKVLFVDVPIYHYRLQNSSVTNKYSPDFYITSKKIIEYMNEFLVKNNLEKELRDVYNIKVMLLFHEIIKLQYVPDDNKQSLKNKIKELRKIYNEQEFCSNKSLTTNKYLNKIEKVKNILFFLRLIFFMYLFNKAIYIYKIKINYKR